MAQFSTNESVCLERSINSSQIPIETNPNDIDKVYELERCIKWIRENNYKKVCLQFPDYLLPDSCEIASHLQDELKQVVYIMGDSAYESCCVDYITAQHVDSDAIIHFGPRCLSTWTNLIPCLCIYEKSTLNTTQFSELFAQKFGSDLDNFMIVLDTPYIHKEGKLHELFKENKNVTVHNIDQSDFRFNECTTLYVGQNNRKLLNFRLKYKVKTLYYYDPEDKDLLIKNYKENNSILKRRHYLIEKIKDSQTIGIIIGTVVIQNFINSINRIKKLLKLHHKNYYTISVGRLTVAKLANFPEMDIYVLICCPMSDVFESRDFFKPIVTPFDIEVALNPKAKDLNFSYEVDLDYTDEIIDEQDINKPDISLLSGKVRCNETFQENIDENNKQLSVKSKGIVALSDKSGAGFLATRSFKGLEQNLGQTEVKLAEEGRKGIPQHYENESF